MRLFIDPRQAIHRFPPHDRSYTFELELDGDIIFYPSNNENLILTIYYYIASLNQAVVIFEGFTQASSDTDPLIYWCGNDFYSMQRFDLLIPNYVRGFSFHEGAEKRYRIGLHYNILYNEIASTWSVNPALLTQGRNFSVCSQGDKTLTNIYRRQYLAALSSNPESWYKTPPFRYNNQAPYWLTSTGSTNTPLEATKTLTVVSSIPFDYGFKLNQIRVSGRYLAKKWRLVWSYSNGAWSYVFNEQAWLNELRDGSNNPHPDFYYENAYVGFVQWNSAATPPPETPGTNVELFYDNVPVCVGGKNMSFTISSTFGYSRTFQYSTDYVDDEFVSATITPPEPGYQSYTYTITMTLNGNSPNTLYHAESETLTLQNVTACNDISDFGANPLAE